MKHFRNELTVDDCQIRRKASPVQRWWSAGIAQTTGEGAVFLEPTPSIEKQRAEPIRAVLLSTQAYFLSLTLSQLLHLKGQGHSLDPEQKRRTVTIGGAPAIAVTRTIVRNLIEQLLVLFQTLGKSSHLMAS